MCKTVIVVAKYNPFAEKAGMREITVQSPPKQALAIAEVLRKLGVQHPPTWKRKILFTKLQTLTANDVEAIKEAFIKHSHARFMK